ncbi:MAG: hypothetical protein IT559_04040 [Alphaproteobacteria bacterium]|nr:hypothetical protein [Alphaproteobacteria bacterium]
MRLTKIFRKNRYKSRLPAGLAALFLFITPPALAQVWNNFVAMENLYSLSFPEPFNDPEVTYLRASDFRVFSANEIIATVDKRPYVPVIKNYILKFSQTLGPAFSEEQRQILIARELESYAQYYATMDGSVLEMIPDAPQGENKGGYIMIGFKDPHLGLQVMRVHVVMTNQSMFHQIITGSEKDMRTPSTEKFFQSLIAQDNLIRSQGQIRAEWKKFKAGSSLFTAYFPEPVKPYVPEPAQATHENKFDRVKARFYDPVLKQNIFVNVYGYELDRKITETEANLFLEERFINRHGSNLERTKIYNYTKNGFPVIEAVYPIRPPNEFGYLNTVRVRIMYSRNYIMAYEVRASSSLAKGDFVTTLIQQTSFHPGQAQKEKNKLKKGGGAVNTILNETDEPEDELEDGSSAESSSEEYSNEPKKSIRELISEQNTPPSATPDDPEKSPEAPAPKPLLKDAPPPPPPQEQPATQAP